MLPDGRKVFPGRCGGGAEAIAGVRDCAVIGPDQVHAVLALEGGAEPSGLSRKPMEIRGPAEDSRGLDWPAGEICRALRNRQAETRRDSAADCRRTEAR